MFSLISIIIVLLFIFFAIKNLVDYQKKYNDLLYSKEYNIREFVLKEKELKKKHTRPIKIVILVFLSLFVFIKLIAFLNN